MSGTRIGTVALVFLLSGALDPVLDLDPRVRDMAQQSRSPALEPWAHAATDLGKPVVVFGGLLAIAIFTGPLGPETARLALLALAPANLFVEVTKRAVDRPRPDGEHKRSNASFPSSHSANAVALAYVLGRRWRQLSPAFWLLAAAVCWSRIYLNRHFLSDVLVGVAIGVVCAWGACRWFQAGARPRASR